MSCQKCSDLQAEVERLKGALYEQSGNTVAWQNSAQSKDDELLALRRVAEAARMVSATVMEINAPEEVEAAVYELNDALAALPKAEG